MRYIQNERLKTISFPQGPKAKLVTKHQELIRKDVGGLSCFKSSISHCTWPTHLLEEEDIGIIMRVCAILHNMNVENVSDNYEFVFDYYVIDETTLELIVSHKCHPCYETFFQRTIIIYALEIHARL